MSLQHLLLGMLNQTPMSGYDLDKAFQRSAGHFWTTDRSQIYRTLHKLHKAELVEVEHVVQEDLPDRKVYHLTDTGRAELERWLTTPIARSEDPAREGWLGQLYFAKEIANQDVLHLLRTYHEELQHVVAALGAMRAHILAQIGDRRVSREGKLRLMTLDYGIFIQQAAADWIAQQIVEIKQWDDGASTGDDCASTGDDSEAGET